MEPPKPEKKQYGCMAIIWRVVFAIAIIALVDYLSAWIFRMIIPYDNLTTTLIPFQNGYLARTDAFLTTEFNVIEFSTNPGPAGRFLSLCIFVVVASFFIGLILAFIPFLKSLLDYYWYVVSACFLLLMIKVTFYPSLMTVFDRDNRIMTIHKPEWIFFGTKSQTSFDQISGFTYQVHRTSGVDHYEDLEYADILAITVKGDSLVIGENQVGVYENGVTRGVIDKENDEAAEAVKALTKLIGK